MFGNPAAFSDGYMFFGVFGDDLFVRVAPEAMERALAVPGVRPFEPMPGRAMSGYVVLPSGILQDARETARWIEAALAACRRLPTKRGRAAAGSPKTGEDRPTTRGRRP